MHESDGEFYARLLRAYFDSANDAIFVLCNELKFLSCNRRMESWLGLPESELTRHNCRRPITDLVGNTDTAKVFEQAARKVFEGESQCFECLLEPADAAQRWVEINMTRVDVEAGEMVIAVARDTTERREQMARIYYQSTHDVLTGLPNRTSLQRFLDGCDRTGAMGERPLVMLVIDVLHFRDVNEALGHQMADEVLKTIASRLKEVARQFRDTRIYRLESDRFVMVCGKDAAQHWAAVVEAVQQGFAAPIEQSGLQLTLGSNIGVASYPAHVSAANGLVQAAEAALHAVKQQAASSVRMYYRSRDASGKERLALLNDLRKAIATAAIDVDLQPIVPVHGPGAVRLEALARWHHPERGQIPPERFVALAETSGQILALTWRVIERALQDAAPLIREGCIGSLSINLSPYCLLDAGFPTRFAALMAQHRVAPGEVMLEITESVAMSERMQQHTVLSLRELGVELSVDDFGTGHSSLSKLRQLPVAELKIDRSFVTGMLSSDNDEAIVRATIQLAHSLGLEVVAEGIEDGAVLERLGELGCNYAQGRFICDPLPAGELLDWLKTRQTERDAC